MDSETGRGYPILMPLAVVSEHGHQVFGAREHENIGLLAIAILRQTLIGLPRDGGNEEAPPEPVGAVAGGGS